MSAESLRVLTLELPNPDYSNDPVGTYTRLNSSISFTYTSPYNIRTLSSNGARPGADVTGLLFTPTLPEDSSCNNASAQYLPANVTRRADLPDVDYDLIAIAPWISPECVQEYFTAARTRYTQGFLWYLPGDDSSDQPPEPNSNVWGLGDGGAWKRQNDYPVYAIPGATAQTLLKASAQYSGNMSDVPYGNRLTQAFDRRNYVRLYVDVDTSGSNTVLPSLWVFLLAVLGVLLGVIALTSFSMHYLQRRRRRDLRRRVVRGEVDLEALGIKRLTVPSEVLGQLPVYIYGSGAAASPATVKPVEPVKEPAPESSKLESAHSSRPSSPLPTTRPSPAKREGSFHPTPLQQPTCAICLDDFVAASPETETEGTTVRELPCHHIFHPECVDTFLLNNSSLCPMCKKSALPTGYCPRVLTNNMVRRERMMRRIRERYGNRGSDGDAEQGHQDFVPPLPSTTSTTLGSRIRSHTRTFSNFRANGGRRISSAPVGQAMSEMSPPAPAVVRSSSVASHRPSRVQPENTAGRREWARQRAEAMLGRRAAPSEEDEARATTPRWRKAIRGVFPGVGGR